MAHQVESMAWAGQVPWHGLGARVDSNVSVEEMLEAAGLGWELERKPLMADMGDGEMLPIEDKSAWIRNTDRRIMAVSSNNWRPLQPAETIGFMRNYVAAGAATLETAGSLRDGKVVWGLARLNHDFEVRAGDKVNGYLLITSPNTVGSAITIRTTTVRVVCANTMALAEQGGTVQYRQNHMSQFDVEAAKAAVGEAHEQLLRAEQNAKTLDRLKLSISDAITKVLVPVFHPEIAEDAEVMRQIEKPQVMPKKLAQILESVERAPGNKEIADTGWAVMNGVTHWADHVYGHNAGTRMMRSWMGDNSRHKLEVERRLLELAE